MVECNPVQVLFKQDNVVLSTQLIMQLDHRKEFLKLTFEALALCQNSVVEESNILKIMISTGQTKPLSSLWWLWPWSTLIEQSEKLGLLSVIFGTSLLFCELQ